MPDGTSVGMVGSTGGTAVELCDDQDPDLVACYDFVGADGGTAIDRSSNANDGVATGVTLGPSPTGWAARAGMDGSVVIPDDPSLDLVAELTVEAWVFLDSLPQSTRYGIFDNDGQYSLLLQEDEGWRCDSDGENILAALPEVGVWTHVACVLDANDNIIYVNGVEAGRMPRPGGLDGLSTDPISLLTTSPDFDEPVDGLVDMIRVWRVARTPQQICVAAGLDSC